MNNGKYYTYWFLVPAAIIYTALFLAPTFFSFYFSLTRWNLFNHEFIGLENFAMFFKENSLNIGFRNTLVYAFGTTTLKVIFGFLLAVLLSKGRKGAGFVQSVVFFPNIISTIAIGITFSKFMHPTLGLINTTLSNIGIMGPDWLGNPDLALFSVVLVDTWKGVGMATIIFLAGIKAIPTQYYEAMAIDGSNSIQRLVHLTLPLSRQAFNSVIILALISGLRMFDLVWTMTKGGPGFSSDLIASIIYKQFQGGFYGLATAGNVLLFFVVAFIAFPLFKYLTSKEVDL